MPELPVDNLGLSDDGEKVINTKWNTIATALTQMARMGISYESDPPDVPFPDITPAAFSENSNEFVAIVTNCLVWTRYLKKQLGIIEAMIRQNKNEQEEIEATIRQNIRRMEDGSGKKTAKEEMTDIIRLDPRYVELLQDEQLLAQSKKGVEDEISHLGAVRQTLSRSIELKKMEFEAARTASSAPRKFQKYRKPEDDL